MSSQNNNQNLTHTYVNVVSTNQPAWAGYTYIDFNTAGYCIHDVTLQFNLSAITGITASSALMQPSLCSAFKFFTNVTVTNNNNVIDSIDSQANYLLSQMYTSYEDVQFLNVASGSPMSQLSRFNMGQTNTTYQVNLKSLFPQVKIECLNGNSFIRIAILLDALTNLVSQSSLTGTPLVTINSVSALFKVTKYSNELVQQKLFQLSKNPLMKTFNSVSYQPFVIQANSSTVTIALSNFVGLNVQYLFFVVRPSTAITKNDGLIFSPIASYNVLSATGESVCGGLITSAQALYIYGKSMTLGNIMTDPIYGNIYSVFHTSDPISTMVNMGSVYGSRLYLGSEALQINLITTTAVALNVDVYASCTSVYKQNQNASIIKLIV